jgi:acetyl esterase
VDGQPLAMDSYLPQGAGPFPALIAIHGGGFVGGDKSEMRGVSIFFARNGYAVFSIDYRLAPSEPYPAAVDDARAAVAFLRDHAAELRVDPDRIGALGTSAGGTIAMSLAAGAGQAAPGEGVVAAVSWSGVLDLAALAEQRGGNPTAVSDVASYIGMPDSDLSTPGAQTLLREASPINQVEPGGPPMFVANARREVIPVAQAEAFVARLGELGVPHDLFLAEQGHALRYAREASPPTLEFLEEFLAGAQGSPTSPPPPTVTATPTAPSTDAGSTIAIVVLTAALLALLTGGVLSALRRRRG